MDNNKYKTTINGKVQNSITEDNAHVTINSTKVKVKRDTETTDKPVKKGHTTISITVTKKS